MTFFTSVESHITQATGIVSASRLVTSKTALHLLHR